MKQPFVFILLFLVACGPRASKTPVPEKPGWLSAKPFPPGYYTGIGHALKTSNTNYIQEAKKSAFDDLVSEIKVNVSSTSVLSLIDNNKEIQERFEQIIQTDAEDEIEEFEQVDAWEDADNYWVYYRLSKERYRQIKEEQKRNATLLATDYYKKGLAADVTGDRVQALSFYFQAFRSVEKYLGEAIRVTIADRDVLLVNEIYASIQLLLSRIDMRVSPSQVTVNRRVNQTAHTITLTCSYKDLKQPATDVPIAASFEKGAGDIFPTYTTGPNGQSNILINKISSRELDQTISLKLDLKALTGNDNSDVFELIVNTLNLPVAQIDLKVVRPVVYISAEERSFGYPKPNLQITNKIKNLLANAGFEFTDAKNKADLWLDVRADAEEGSIAGSIHTTFVTSTIRVTAVQTAKEVYSTTLDRIKGYGLDFDRSSIDGYNKTLEVLETNRMNELLDTILQ